MSVAQHADHAAALSGGPTRPAVYPGLIHVRDRLIGVSSGMSATLGDKARVSIAARDAGLVDEGALIERRTGPAAIPRFQEEEATFQRWPSGSLKYPKYPPTGRRR
jgi:hypothetical protein